MILTCFIKDIDTTDIESFGCAINIYSIAASNEIDYWKYNWEVISSTTAITHTSIMICSINDCYWIVINS